MNTFLYARISTPNQDLLNQVPQLEKWANDRDIEAKCITDIGSGKNMKRDGIRHLIKEVESGNASQVVVVSINRLGRNVNEVWRFCELCRKNNCNVISIRENIDINNPFGRAMIQILAVLGELENEIRSEATKAGIARARANAEKKGKAFRFGGSIKGWSFKVTEDIALAIKVMHDAGKSYRAIAKVVHLDAKTVANVIKYPRDAFLTRAELAKHRKKGK